MHCFRLGPLEIFATEARYFHASSRAFMQVTTNAHREPGSFCYLLALHDKSPL